MDRAVSDAPEFSRPVTIEDVEAGPVALDIVASEDERAALAKRFGLRALHALSAHVILRRAGKSRFRLEGHFEAETVQNCVVTNEPVPRHVKQALAEVYVVQDATEAADALNLPPVDEDWAEPVTDGVIDVGEAVAQNLILALDDYPRLEGAKLEGGVVSHADTPQDPAAGKPFRALSGILRGR